MLLSVDFPIPDFFANSINVNPFEVLVSHNKTFILLTSFRKESVQGDRFVQKNGGVLHEIRCQKTECQKEHKGKDYRKSKEAGQKAVNPLYGKREWGL